MITNKNECSKGKDIYSACSPRCETSSYIEAMPPIRMVATPENAERYKRAAEIVGIVISVVNEGIAFDPDHQTTLVPAGHKGVIIYTGSPERATSFWTAEKELQIQE